MSANALLSKKLYQACAWKSLNKLEQLRTFDCPFW